MSQKTGPAVVLQNLEFGYVSERSVLQIEELEIPRGEKLFIYGPSGSGKTTLLGLLTGILAARSGRVNVLGSDLATMKPAARDALRGAHIGYIFQMFNLLPYLNVLENILLPCRLNPARRAALKITLESAAHEIAKALEIEPLLEQNTAELSVGQQQRVAAARALIGSPELVIADEPTSALDADRREIFLKLLFNICEKNGTTLIFVSHDRSLEKLFNRALSLPAINAAALEETS